MSDVERDGAGEAGAQPSPHAGDAPDAASSEPDGASGHRDDDRDDPLDRS